MEAGGDRMTEPTYDMSFSTKKLRPVKWRAGKNVKPLFSRCVELHNGEMTVHLHVRKKEIIDAMFITPHGVPHVIPSTYALKQVVMAKSWEEAVGVLR